MSDVSSGPLPTTPLQRIPQPPVHVMVVVLVGLVYLAVFFTGFRWFTNYTGTLQPLPVYVSLSILLLALQLDISRTISTARVLYLLGTSGFAVLYAAAVWFSSGALNVIRE